ncbi:MAG: hypothetical protein IRY99_26840, partial [Isosphaeraceae bacterium]|nr:hypothetical protein [Isosphaeraceae bacterium]
ALALFRDLASQAHALASEDYTLSFELVVEDEQGRRTSRAFSIPVTNDRRGLYQERVDQSSTEGSEPILRATLAATFHFDPTDSGQVVRVTNADTDGNVSVRGIALHRVGDEEDEETVITVQDKGVQLDGAWTFLDRDGVTTCEDNNDNKGESLLTLPIVVDRPGEYRVALLYRRGGGELPSERNGRRRPRPDNASNVLVEVVSHDPSRLERARDLPRPPAGEAHFLIDQTVDTIAWWDLQTSFRFESDEHYVEVSNRGTKLPVFADAVRFTRADGSPGEVIIDDPKAEGRERWKPSPKQRFRAYNQVGPGTLTDGGDKQEVLSIRYVPAKVEGWDRSAFHRVGISYPGKAGNETRVPIVVRAAASSPIVRLQAPRHAHIGAEVMLDATACYNIQGTPLKVTWVQVGGPKVTLSDPHAPRATFQA